MLKKTGWEIRPDGSRHRYTTWLHCSALKSVPDEALAALYATRAEAQYAEAARCGGQA
jgi:hypothetical protein